MTTNAANLQEASLEHPTKASSVDCTSFVRRRLHDNDILLRPRSSVTIFTRHCYQCFYYQCYYQNQAAPPAEEIRARHCRTQSRFTAEMRNAAQPLHQS
jgi:hypothetical protein